VHLTGAFCFISIGFPYGFTTYYFASPSNERVNGIVPVALVIFTLMAIEALAIKYLLFKIRYYVRDA